MHGKRTESIKKDCFSYVKSCIIGKLATQESAVNSDFVVVLAAQFELPKQLV